MTDHWRSLAACRDMDVDLFFPTTGGNAKAAKAVCATCPVTASCAAYARSEHIRSGIWGGQSLDERQRTRRYRDPVPIIPRKKESA